MTNSISSISSSFYPLPQPLSFILRYALCQDTDFNRDQNTTKLALLKEDMQVGLELLIQNCFMAIDALYFSTPSIVRNSPAFQHRLCIRISTNLKKRTLSITDLGCGMSRADLINSLAAGRLSSNTIDTIRSLSTTRDTTTTSSSKAGSTSNLNTMHEDSMDSDTDSDSLFGDEETNCLTFSSMNGNHGTNGVHTKSFVKDHNPPIIPCRSVDIGGFYAALCSLGTSIEVGTKSKFDDYYELRIGHDSLNHMMDCDDGKSENGQPFTYLQINRPLPEGSKPSLSNGFTNFEDVRGESGTKVTITLSDAAIAAGFLNEKEVLLPLLEKCLEKSPYHAAFSGCCNQEEIDRILLASEREEKEINSETDHTDVSTFDVSDVANPTDIGVHYSSVKERSKFIPLRLSLGERKMLRLVEAAMVCSDYTSNVDKEFKSSTRRMHMQLKGITSIIRGLVIACDEQAGKNIQEDENYSEYETFVQKIFEIARRHKIMNPEKMRTEYGKLIYLMQDAVSPSVQPLISLSCKRPIETVYSFLEERGGLPILDDKCIDIATREVLPAKKSRDQIATEIKKKEKAVSLIKQRYRSLNLSSDDIHMCLYSISDNESYLNSNRVPIDKMIAYLQDYFTPGKFEEGYSLSIVSGQDGARLSHSHERQYYFILQSLTLWRDIINDMFRLWAMAEQDLLSETVSYNLMETGQGLQRIQQSPRTYKAMQQILANVQKKVNHWVGSSVIHLGDHNVPNALNFIDKYTQVPRILGPIVLCLEQAEKLYNEDEGIKALIVDGYGGLDCLKKDILYDFFRTAFDGSGADNFYDAGSCIDGRLTSAWNWASRIADKDYYCIFRLTGFLGFDGEFK